VIVIITEISQTELVIKRIKNLMKIKKLTPYRIAKNGNFHHATINTILNGKFKNPKIDTISKFCKGIGISVRDFYDDDLFN